MTSGALRTVTFSLVGRICRGELPGLCSHLGTLLDETPAAIALCDVSAAEADVVTIEALARLHLAARRRGCRMQLRGPSPVLRGLIAFTGLERVLAAALCVEPGRQLEERE